MGDIFECIVLYMHCRGHVGALWIMLEQLRFYQDKDEACDPWVDDATRETVAMGFRQKARAWTPDMKPVIELKATRRVMDGVLEGDLPRENLTS